MKTDRQNGEARKFDANFKGPIHNRGCTDVLCCILFILFLFGYFAVGLLAWSQGDPRKVIYPTDSRGQFCGQAGTPMEKKPLLFYFNILKCASPLVLLELQCPTTQICVETCPKEHLTLLTAKLSLDRKKQDYYRSYCKEGTNFTKMSAPDILSQGLCPAMLIPSQAFTHRCLPALGTLKGVVVVGNETSLADNAGDQVNATQLLDAAKKSNLVVEARQVAMRIFEDYTVSWYWILLGLVIAMVVSFVFIVLLRYLAGVMIWVMIILVILVIGYGIFHCYWEFASLKGVAGADVTIKDLGLQTDFSIYLQIRQTWLAFMIILAIVEVVIILLLIFLRKRILIAIALIKEASRAVGHVMSSLFYPLLTFCLLAMVIAYWAVTAVFLSTSNEQVYKVFNISAGEFTRNSCVPESFSPNNFSAGTLDTECRFAFYGGETLYHKYLIVLQFYNLFLFFWCANFVTALGQVTLAGAFASYYWAFKKPEHIPAYPIFASLGRALRFHTGSLAFGSLILSLVQIVRVLLEYLDHKLKGAQNRCAKFILSCMKCCFWCLEKFIKFINRNAYIMIAIYGKSFCPSAKDAFFLLMRNVIRVAVLDKVTDFLLFLGKLLIVGIVGICSFFFFSGRIKAVEETAPSLNYYWVPILTLVVGSYLIAHGFFSVYAMCVDTLFLCFCEDLERNDGSSERPYYMSPELHEILSKAMKPEETPGESQGDGGSPGEEATPLSQQGSEVQLKHQALLTTEQEQETLLKAGAEAPTAAAEEEEEEEEEESEGKAGPKQEAEKKEEKVEEKIGSQEEVKAKEEEVKAVAEKEINEEKKDETGGVEPAASNKE
ncbi:choline transporter-like protein 2 isoform X2 [Gadus macrocephalus]|uniref:choline transporter-like protein 2 isoform X2 n=1 Tax=Gadus macrocephalus TaxID=80720 RepID=UPI0028CB6AA9|nr:choline transporter-like protein 2 isoform X2 [Gadus macrocephalus]